MADSEEQQIERRTDSFLRDILDNLDQYAFGIITQHGYRELENMLNKHAEEIEKKFHRWFLRGLIAFALVGLGVVLGLVGYGIVLGQQGDLLATIKDTRKAFVLDACQAQNKNHNKTVAKLDKGLAQAKKQHPERVRQIKQSKKFTISLIDALAPVQNCKRLAKVSVGEAKPPPPTVHTEGSP